jgi:hypothetical protein
MRGKRRRQVSLLAVAFLLAFGLWATLSRLIEPRGTLRRFEVHGSADFYNLLLDSSVANCSGGQPFKVK